MKHGKKIMACVLAVALVGAICLAATGAATGEDPPPIAPAPTTAPATQSAAFTDVPAGSWYGEAANWCRDNGMMNGTSSTTFGPNSAMSRAMLATVLYRAAGSPALLEPPHFHDIPLVSWYSEGVAWATQNGMMAGYGNDLFGPDDPVTREQIAAILWRYEGSPAADSGEDFADENSIAAYAAPAVDWARANGIVGGLSDGRFDPKGSATRAQVAVILYRYLNDGETTGDVITTNGGEQISLSALTHQSAGADAAVYYTSDITPEAMMAIYEALNWTPTGNVAVKLSTGEPPASNYLAPGLIADVVHAVNGTIVECNTAYGGQRASTAMHYQVAEDHGFTAIANVVILDENGSMTLPVEGGTQLEQNLVGAHFADYDSYLVLSHFKGHAMAGFGGAIKNISIGLGSQEGKCLIHTAGASSTSPWGGDQDAFLESMGDAGKSVVDALDGQIVYISVMNRLSVDCDCDGNPAQPDMHDIGILASTDPVALDQACIDLVYAQRDGDGASLVERIESRNGLHTLENAEAVGLGSRSYELVSID